MKLSFYIIYLPKTVTYLTPLVNSLLAWSNCDYCLVSNGCKKEEQQLLKDFCQKDTRLSFLHLPFEKIVPHGEALNYLQKNTTAAYFCFMDSDIFATGPFMSDFEQVLKNHQGVFSGTPLWCKAEDGIVPVDYPRIYGRHHHTHDGICIGGTYLAIYDNSILSTIAQTQLIDFRTKTAQNLTKANQQILADFQMHKTFYDTGKILNFSLLKNGCQLQYKEPKHLHHLGGFSRFAKIQSRSLGEKISNKMELLKKGKYHSFLIQLPYYFQIERFLPISILLRKSILLRQIIVEKYISQLIIALINHTSKPIWPKSNDVNLDNKITFITKNLISLYENQLVKISQKTI